MTESTHAAPAARPFTDAEWSQLQSEDLSAGRAVVILMLAIFTTGVFLYAAVAYTVWQGMGFLS
jgi:dolichyl-phosphate-mannose--protein O-mannosyl transferase